MVPTQKEMNTDRRQLQTRHIHLSLKSIASTIDTTAHFEQDGTTTMETINNQKLGLGDLALLLLDYPSLILDCQRFTA